MRYGFQRLSPVTPVTPLPSPEEDVVNDPSDKTTTADTKPTVTDGKAEVRVDQSLADKIIGKAAANGSKEIVIDAVTSRVTQLEQKSSFRQRSWKIS